MEKFDIPLLEAADIECRVQSVSKTKTGKVGATLLIYKDARVDMRVMDKIFGPYNWQRTHEVIDGTLYCNIDIWDEDKKCWVRKQDAGVESNTEKEKGRASDSFKRAGFNVGIGRELYTAPFIWIELWNGEYYSAGTQNNKEVIRAQSSTKFFVSEIEYDENRKIKKLLIVDKDGNLRYSHGDPSQRPVKDPDNQNANQNQNSNQGRNQYQGGYGGNQNGYGNKRGYNQPPAPPAPPAPPQPNQDAPGIKIKCKNCGNLIADAKRADNSVMTASEVAYFSMQQFGIEYCANCQNKLRAMRNGQGQPQGQN